jgi:cellobiose-specific phosphotransferase system component IIB
MQFMAEVQRKNKTLDAKAFRKYAESARGIFNSEEIQKVYDALDELNLSDRSDEDVKKCMDVIVGLKFPGETELSIVRNISIAIMAYKLRIANTVIETQAKAAGIPVEEVDASAFGTMDAVGKFTATLVVIMSVVDVVLNIIDIVDVVEQCNKMCDQLDSTIKRSYKSYFNGIKTSAKEYKDAISPPSPVTPS